MLPLPEIKGIHKIKAIGGVTTATLSKAGKLELAPSYAYDPASKKWTEIDKDIEKALLGDTDILSSPDKTGTSAASDPVL